METWKLVTLQSTSTVSGLSPNSCLGLNVATDCGARVVNLDNIFGHGQATSLLITLTNSLEGEPLDVTDPGDSDDNVVAGSDSIHAMILTHSDKNQHVKDVHWTKTFVGNIDSDDLLEAGERWR